MSYLGGAFLNWKSKMEKINNILPNINFQTFHTESFLELEWRNTKEDF